MTILLAQTFFLLLAAYFAGALTACLAKRWFAPMDETGFAPVVEVAPQRLEASPRQAPPVAAQFPVSATAAAAAAAARAAQTRPVEPIQPIGQTQRPRVEIKPRSIELVQPKIDLLPRPAPRPVPLIADTSRFERALTGPDVNEGVARVPIVEIRPAVFSWVTGPPGPWPPPKKAEPVVEPPPEPTRAPVPALQSDLPSNRPEVVSRPPPSPAEIAAIRERSGVSAAAANAAAAASAALAAARAAAASFGGAKSAKEDEPAPAGAQKTPVDAPPADREARPSPIAEQKPASVAVSASTVMPLIAEGDDLQRVRAIDANTEQALKRAGVTRFDTIARWTADDVDRLNRELQLNGRIDGEQWIEQAQILAKGGETYYSRNRAAAARANVDQKKANPEAGPAMQSSAPQSAAPPSKGLRPETPVASTAVQPIGSAGAVSQRTGDGRSVSEIAAAAAAAIAAASASVTRGIRPIEPISPIARGGPNASIPPKINDAASNGGSRGEEAAALAEPEPRGDDERRTEAPDMQTPIGDLDDDEVIAGDLGDESSDIKEPSARDHQAEVVDVSEDVEDIEDDQRAFGSAGDDEADVLDEEEDVAGGDDLRRIRGIGFEIERRLKAIGVATYDAIANWTAEDIDYFSQQFGFRGRIERESWVEQARILSSGGETEFSRRVDRGEVATSRDDD